MIFTDGASRGNPGPGGWGAIVVADEKAKELGGREDVTTNNRMELKAVISALEYYFSNEEGSNSPKIYTDSSYVLKGATLWLKAWKTNGWKTKAKDDVSNKDLWQKFDAVVDGRKVEWQLVSGHVGVPGNERADVIATKFADNDAENLFEGNLSDYKINILEISFDQNQKASRDAGKKRSGAKAYSYISMVQGEIKIHQTWEECEKRVKGTKGAVYKKSLSPSDERDIIADFKSRTGK